MQQWTVYWCFSKAFPWPCINILYFTQSWWFLMQCPLRNRRSQALNVFGLAPDIHRFLWILSFPMIYCNYGLQIDGEIPKSLALVCWETFLNYLPRQFLTNWRTLSHSCLWTSLSRMPLSHPIIIITCYSPCVLFPLSQLFKKLFAGIKFRMF